jgi:hypothetical protein
MNGGRPMALRRRLSSGLPLSDIVLQNYYITNPKNIALQKLFNLLNLSFTIFKYVYAGSHMQPSVADQLIITIIFVYTYCAFFNLLNEVFCFDKFFHL